MCNNFNLVDIFMHVLLIIDNLDIITLFYMKLKKNIFYINNKRINVYIIYMHRKTKPALYYCYINYLTISQTNISHLKSKNRL